MFSETTAAQDPRGADCRTKSVRSIGQTGQTDLAKTAGSRVKRRKPHQSNEESTSQGSPLPSTIHGKCLMAKNKKKKNPRRLRAKKMNMTLILIS
jgi:hypothetical protein